MISFLILSFKSFVINLIFGNTTIFSCLSLYAYSDSTFYNLAIFSKSLLIPIKWKDLYQYYFANFFGLKIYNQINISFIHLLRLFKYCNIQVLYRLNDLFNLLRFKYLSKFSPIY
jgi:hypothetical protein